MMELSAHIPGKRLGAFEIERRLGAGSFKTVYRAKNTTPEENGYPEIVALAIPHTMDEEAKGLLQKEFRIVQCLNHPSIVRMYGFEEEEQCFFIVSEAVEGKTLSHVLKEKGAIPLKQAVEIIRQAGEALDYAHEGLAIHRDVKPANIIMCKDGTVKVLDFGLARLMTHSMYKAASRIGTIAYMAPEQFEGAAGLNADLWSLGITFYQLITNTFPFAFTDEAYLMKQILYDEPDLVPIETGDFDTRLAGVIRKVLEKEPDKRYKRASEFVSDLESVLRHAAAVNKTEGEIEVLIRAHYPLIYLQTHEEDRALQSLKQIRTAMETQKETGLFIWRETRGLENHEGRYLPGTAGDPLKALDHVVESGHEGIYVFLDIHRHFTPVIVRFIRDAIWTVKLKRKSIVFISPVISLPSELEADSTLLFYDLPDLEELKKVVQSVENKAEAEHEEKKKKKEEVVEGSLKETLARAVLGLTGAEADRVLTRAFIRHNGFNKGCVTEALHQKQQMVKKAKLLEFCSPDSGFSEVGGLGNLKIWFNKRRKAYTGKGARFGLAPPKGVVLVGVPGCGKSLSSKALASEWESPLLRLDLGKIFNKYLGASEANLRKALHTSEAVSPCILWIDELEKAFSGIGQDAGGGLMQRIFGIFLDWLGEKKSPVFVVATANNIQKLPPEFLRKGRFDEIFYVGLPKPEERAAIFKVHIKRVKRSVEDFDIGELVKKSHSYTGAEIQEAVVTGLYRAFEEGERQLTTGDIAEGLANTKPLSLTRGKEIREMERWAGTNAVFAS